MFDFVNLVNHGGKENMTCAHFQRNLAKELISSGEPKLDAKSGRWFISGPQCPTRESVDAKQCDKMGPVTWYEAGGIPNCNLQVKCGSVGPFPHLNLNSVCLISGLAPTPSPN